LASLAGGASGQGALSLVFLWASKKERRSFGQTKEIEKGKNENEGEEGGRRRNQLNCFEISKQLLILSRPRANPISMDQD
jgi:hypothetical protein